MSDYKKELEFAKNLAKDAGRIIGKNFIKGVTAEWKSDNTPVTETDTAVNSLVIKRVKEVFPEHGIIGEEESLVSEERYKWVCDPVDGTVPFTYGIPTSTFSLALTDDGESVVGVVFDPYQNRLFSAVNGSGAYLNGEKIKVSSHASLNKAIIDAEGFPCSIPAQNMNADLYNLLAEKGALITNFWSVILPTALVAAGKYTGAIYNAYKCEDAAAIKVIVEEAGGRVTGLNGESQRYDTKVNGYIASNGLIHEQLVDIIQAHIASNKTS